MLVPANEPEITNLKFSPNGLRILLQARDQVILLDAFDGVIKQRFKGEFSCPGNSSRLDCNFSPDSKYLIQASSSPRQNFIVWNIETGQEVELMKFHPMPVRCVKFSHMYCMLITAC
mmetsp:Transcript_16005/g.24818  ORF Transcript_16005/g.24818 Transcript_16005/m.24818 type:complete len:117 (-) Transcript_16005:61-411(-)